MRIRQVKPAFWADSRLAEVSEATRLFYIGLWMIADDAGWFRWDQIEIARDLYGYETRTRRERRVATMFDSLVDLTRVVLHPCGHAEIPRMTVHQRLSGPTKQVQTSLNEHLRTCHPSPPPAITRDGPLLPASPRTERNGTEQERERVGKGTGKGKGSARPLAPDGAGALTEEDLPAFLRVVSS
jgi:hypothetical protein